MSFGGAHSPSVGSGRLSSMATRTGPIFQAPQSASISGPGSGEKKVRKNRACTACKAGHLKCDHGVPSCARCVSKRIPCFYNENPPPQPPPRQLVFVDHAFPERSQGLGTTTIHTDESYSLDGSTATASPTHFASALSPSSGDFGYSHAFSGSSPLSATGFHTLSMNPEAPQSSNYEMSGMHHHSDFMGSNTSPNHSIHLDHFDHSPSSNFVKSSSRQGSLPNMVNRSQYQAPSLPSDSHSGTTWTSYHHQQSSPGGDLPPSASPSDKSRKSQNTQLQPPSSSSGGTHPHSSSSASSSSKPTGASPPPSPKIKKRRRAPSPPSGAPPTASAPSSVTSTGPLSGTSVTPSYSTPSSPQNSYSTMQTYDDVPAPYPYDSAYISAGSSPHTSHTNSPHSTGFSSAHGGAENWDENAGLPTNSYYAPTAYGPRGLYPMPHGYGAVPYNAHGGRGFPTHSHYGFAHSGGDMSRSSVSPVHRTGNPLQMSAPQLGSRPSGASSLPTNLPSAYSSHGSFTPHLEMHEEHMATNFVLDGGVNYSGVHPSHSGADLLDSVPSEHMMEMQPYLDVQHAQHWDGSAAGTHDSDVAVYGAKRHVASPGSPNAFTSLAPPHSPTHHARRSGSGPANLGSSSPAILARSAPSMAFPGHYPQQYSPQATFRPSVPAGGHVVQHKRESFPSSPLTLPRQTFMRSASSKGSSRHSSPSMINTADPEIAELLTVFDGFMTLFEPRSVPNLDVHFSPQESRYFWSSLLGKEPNFTSGVVSNPSSPHPSGSGGGGSITGGNASDELTFILNDISTKLRSAEFETHFSGVRSFIRWYEQCIVLLCGCLTVNWTVYEQILAKQAEKMTNFYATCERFDFDSADNSDKEVARLCDAFAMYAAYFRDKGMKDVGFNTLLNAYHLVCPNSSKFRGNTQTADRLWLWTHYIVAPADRANLFQMLTQAGFGNLGSTPMAQMVTMQTQLLNMVAFGPRETRFDNDHLMRMWSQLDEFEALVSSLERTNRTRPFRYLRIGAGALLRAEIQFRWGSQHDVAPWLKHLQDIASLSPGMKAALVAVIKTFFEQSTPDGDVRGLSCTPLVLSHVEAATPGSGNFAFSGANVSGFQAGTPTPPYPSTYASPSSQYQNQAGTPSTPVGLASSSNMVVSSPSTSKVSTPVPPSTPGSSTGGSGSNKMET